MKKNKISLAALLVCVFLFPVSSVFGQTPLSLEDCIMLGLQNSPAMRSAASGVRAGDAQKKEALTGFFPELRTSYSYTRLNEAPELKFPGIPPSIPAMNIPAGDQNTYLWALEARQPLFAGGKILAGYQISAIVHEASRVSAKAQRQEVVYEVKAAYFDVLRANRILETARQSVEMLTRHQDVAAHFFQAGLIPKNDFLRADVALALGQQRLIRAQNALALAGARLNTLLKRDPSEPVLLDDILDYSPMTQSFDSSLAEARQRRPELLHAKLRAQMAAKQVVAARSEYWPKLQLIANYSRYGDTPSVSGSDLRDAESWSVMGMASWTFWEWGKTKFRVDASLAAENQAIDAVEQLEDHLRLEILNAYLLIREAESQIRVSEKVILQADENFRISEERYKQRVAASTDVLDAQTILTRAKFDYANALADYGIQQARLERAMGTLGL